MDVRGTDFVLYFVDEWDAAITFYRDTLGLKLDFCKDKAKWAEFSIPPTTLALFGGEDDAPIRNGPGGSAVVLGISNFEETLKELESSGIEVTWRKEFGPCYMAMISDPCGNPVFIHERKDGTFG